MPVDTFSKVDRMGSSNNAINTKSLLSCLRGVIDRHVKQRPRDTLVRNAMEDPAEPLVQRVVEEDACDFCKQLGTSRPVKPSQIASQYHQYCKCHEALFFQETRFKERFVGDEQLGRLGIMFEDGADPDDWEKRDALVLAALGRQVKFLKRHKSGARRADTLVDGDVVEFKNPTKGEITTVRNQVLNCLYGSNRRLIKPQSDWLIISNVRSSMTMLDMEQGLEFAISGADPLRPDELAAIKRITLLDVRTRRMRTYEL